ncbi:MAG: NUDIX domain-containing protein [Alphaproteobacteria bacterium]|nr:NUDIX domain-containing protein [Alphaproteobacteria bacterium]
MSKKKFDLINRETLFQGCFRVDKFHVRHESFSGGWTETITREVFDHGPGAVGVLPFDPQHDKVVLVEQFRAGVMARDEDPWLLELVAGILEPGESKEAAIRREAVEEAGCEITDLRPITSYYTSPGCMSENISLYAGRAITTPPDGSVHGLAEEGEDIRVHVLDAAQAISLLYAGKLRDAATIIAMQWFALHHTELRSRWLMGDASMPII